MFAWAMGCDGTRTGLETVSRSKGRLKWETVTTAPCKEVILKDDMETFIAAEPRAWHDILKHYHGQPYPVFYRAFGNLRHRLGRTNDPPWYRYTVSDKPIAWEARPQASNHSDPRRMKTAG